MKHIDHKDNSKPSIYYLISMHFRNIRRIIMLSILTLMSIMNYGQIIADHTVVDQWDDIPQQWIDAVKTMVFTMAGESHRGAYSRGLTLVELMNPKYALSIVSYPSSGHQAGKLTFNGSLWGDIDTPNEWVGSYGEEDWWTTNAARAVVKKGFDYCKTKNYSPDVLGWMWCYDLQGGNHTEGVDPVYGCHWYGWARTEGDGPDGPPWGLDAEDSEVTGIPQCLDMYLDATQDYIDYCTTNNIDTKIFFVTGPEEAYGGSEAEYQTHLKNQRIRDYVKAHPSAILFDYADILCYNDNNVLTTGSWNGHTFPYEDPVNITPVSDGHISEAGCLRIGKALWWMLARIAGWNGSTTNIPVTGITLSGAGGATTITSDNGTLQISAAITPDNASDKTVTWSVEDGGTGEATISTSGLVTAVSNGTVTIKATANDGSGKNGTLNLTLSNQIVPVASITVSGAGGTSIITTENGTLQLNASVLPDNATDKTVTWSIQDGTGHATISSSGLVTAVSAGTVIAKATANDGSGISGTLTITISTQIIPVTQIVVTGEGGRNTITNNDHGILQLSTTVTPENATDNTVTWSIQNGTGHATISASGLVTAISNGTVTAKALANDGSGVYGTLTITISGLTEIPIPVETIVVYAANFSNTISSQGGTLQLLTYVFPEDASNKSVTWSLQNGAGVLATINSNGLLKAIANGEVTVKATATDGSGVSDILNITITNQVTTGILDHDDEESVLITRNASQLVIQCQDAEQFQIVCLYDIMGRLITNQRLISDNYSFDVSSLKPGIYILVLSGIKGKKAIKMSLP